MEKNTIQIADHIIEIQRPTLKTMHQLKESLGADVLTGLSGEQSAKLSTDFRKMADICTIICKVYKGIDQPEGEGEYLKFKEASDFFFDNLEISDFRRIMSFFSKASNQSSADSEASQMNQNAQKTISPDQIKDSTMSN